MAEKDNHLVFSKSELINRVLWVNNFRFILGLFFFLNFTVLLIFHLYMDPGYEASLVLGLFLFAYAFLTRYYLTSQKNITLGEVIFLSSFLAVLDLIFTTGFVYFTGLVESPHIVIYLINLVSIPIMFPYYPAAVFIWAGVASLIYVFTIYATHMGMLTLLPGYIPGLARDPTLTARLRLINSFAIPLMFFVFATLAFFISKQVLSLSRRIDRFLVDENGVKEEVAALSNISWILTRVFDLNYMLERTLEETFKILRLRTGAIFVANPGNKKYVKKMSLGVPTDLANYLARTEIGELPDPNDTQLKKLLGREKIEDILPKLIIAPKNNVLGMMVLFIRPEDKISQRGLKLLDTIINELAIALGYALFYDKIRLKKGKKKTE